MRNKPALSSASVTKLLAVVLGVAFGVALAIGDPISAAAQAQPSTTHKALTATPASVDIPIPDIRYTKFVLDNGLTVLVHEDHKAPIVAVNTWYHVGSKNEKPGIACPRSSRRKSGQEAVSVGCARMTKTRP